ncbi:MAG: GIY-YIG nuclease family protein, partial [Alistipes sp.]
MPQEFFPIRPEITPTIYAYELIGVETHSGLLKVGYTDRDAKTRVAEQLKTSAVKYRIVFEESAMRNDGSSFTDHDLHRWLRRQGFENPEGEWFRCEVEDVHAALCEMKSGEKNEDGRTLAFAMRPEQ